MLFDKPIAPQTYALIRFGIGFPARGSPTDAAAILKRLAGPDRMASLWPVVSFEAARKAGVSLQQARKDKRMDVPGADQAIKDWRVWINMTYGGNFVTDIVRCVETDDPFRERLHRFWANHFTARARSGLYDAAASGFTEEAVRPHLTGRFADMLKAAVTHPFMLLYLDQVASVGPNSPRGLASGRGLNENLAREVLELHTLGVGSAYSQADVTQFAELLTGLSFNLVRGSDFRPHWAEPGSEQVLGISYGGDNPSLDDIHAVLDDLALHPATARHLCTKLAAHFVADMPDPDLVAHMAQAYTESDGHLTAVYGAMLEHPAAWAGFGAKVKQPIEYMASSLRALRVRGDMLQDAKPKYVRNVMLRTLQLMGQPYQKPPGPDGWPDSAEAWVHPHGIAARIAWALRMANAKETGPRDPRAFVQHALGDAASDTLIWAAGAAESRADGIALVLASAEFNRR